jgi:hypothetical protein
MPYKDPDVRKAFKSRYSRNRRTIIKEQQESNWKERPWLRLMAGIRGRCLNKTHHYYKLGIKYFINSDDVKFLWDRDNAWLLKKASIDRINPSGHYTICNCRIIELSDNLRGKKRSSLKPERTI